MVRVHLEHVVVPPLQGPAEPREIGRAEAELPFPVQNVHPGLFRGQGFGQPARAVRRTVVHHQDLQARILGEYLRHEAGHILHLVVGGDDDQSAFRHADEPAARPAAQ